MRNRKLLTKVFACAIGVFLFLALFFPFLDFLVDKIDVMLEEHIQEIIFDTSREQALMDLSSLRGRVEELQILYSGGKITANGATARLQVLSFFQNSANPYLADFTVTITSSDVGDICKEIILQIDQRISYIRFESGVA